MNQGFMYQNLQDELAGLIYQDVCEHKEEWPRKALAVALFGQRSESDVQHFSRRINPDDGGTFLPAPKLAALAMVLGSAGKYARFFARLSGEVVYSPPPENIEPEDLNRLLGSLHETALAPVKKATAAAETFLKALHPDSPGGRDITPAELEGIMARADEGLAGLLYLKAVAKLLAQRV